MTCFSRIGSSSSQSSFGESYEIRTSTKIVTAVVAILFSCSVVLSCLVASGNLPPFNAMITSLSLFCIGTIFSIGIYIRSKRASSGTHYIETDTCHPVIKSDLPTIFSDVKESSSYLQITNNYPPSTALEVSPSWLFKRSTFRELLPGDSAISLLAPEIIFYFLSFLNLESLLEIRSSCRFFLDFSQDLIRVEFAVKQGFARNDDISFDNFFFFLNMLQEPSNLCMTPLPIQKSYCAMKQADLIELKQRQKKYELECRTNRGMNLLESVKPSEEVGLIVQSIKISEETIRCNVCIVDNRFLKEKRMLLTERTFDFTFVSGDEGDWKKVSKVSKLSKVSKYIESGCKPLKLPMRHKFEWHCGDYYVWGLRAGSIEIFNRATSDREIISSPSRQLGLLDYVKVFSDPDLGVYVVAGNAYGDFFIHFIQSGNQLLFQKEIQGKRFDQREKVGIIKKIAFTQDGHIIALHAKEINVWNLEQATLKVTFPSKDYDLCDFYLIGNQYIVCSYLYGNHLDLFNIFKQKYIRSFIQDDGKILSFKLTALNSGYIMAAITEQAHLYLWDFRLENYRTV